MENELSLNLPLNEEYTKYRKSKGYGKYKDKGYKNFDKKKSYEKQKERQREEYSEQLNEELNLNLEL